MFRFRAMNLLLGIGFLAGISRPHLHGDLQSISIAGRFGVELGVFRFFVGWWRIPKGADEAFFGAQVGKQVGQFDFSGAHQSA